MISSRKLFVCKLLVFTPVNLLLMYFDLSNVLLLVILSPNDTVSVCQREIQLICTVTGSVLIWDNGSNSTSFSSTGNTVPQYIAPFSFILQSHGNGTLVSVATVNVSTSINGSTLECRDTIAVTDSRKEISFNVKRKYRV